ncbi:hypothetical protein NLU13_5634 [Sarocladium strictum]|uniref:Uncharacterized protein n=1 Tax=Sarocladium strictum TaxID=5046 RepID=A0AA39GHL1_SARSR|nr:hypothetical protein NLU13_5634 [Sarocladium strictum]
MQRGNERQGGVVVLNGFPGVGKLSILKQVKAALQEASTSRIILIDNHLLIDPVAAVLPDRNAEHHELRRAVRAPIFQTLRGQVQKGQTVLMTACLAEGDQVDAAFFNEYLDLVRGTDVKLFWVNAYCDQATMEERLTSPDRSRGTKTKLTNVDVLRELICSQATLRPKGVYGDVQLVADSLDVGGSVESSVDKLLHIIGT